MYRIKIQKRRPSERWQVLADERTDLGKTVKLLDGEASESDQLSVQVWPPAEVSPAVRVFVGSVLVASSIQTDRVVTIDYDDSGDAAVPPLVGRGKLLADWVGYTEMAVEVRVGDSAGWAKALVLPLAVSAGKLETAQFNQLFTELERASAAVLLDVHGKTRVGLMGSRSLASSSPVAVLTRVAVTVRELDSLLHPMARRPASRLRTQWTREQALVGQAIADATLQEACRDPSLLGRRGAGVVFREHLREHSRPDYRIAEHQLIADFAEYLKAQLTDLRHRIDLEIEDREARKRWRNWAREPGQPTWWEAEDLPRIEELQRCRQELTRLRGTVDGWGRLPFLPPGRCLRTRPPSTPLFRNNGLYRRAFRVMAGHFLTYQATLDTHQLLTRARSLPVLYEWWCAVRVIGILARGLAPLLHDPLAAPVLSTRLAQEGGRFTIEFTQDQAINFTDSRGARVRFRYQPVYPAGQEAAGLAVAALDAGASRTPDMVLEIFPAAAAVPELIVVLDAKYSSATQWDKLNQVAARYSKIGDVRTGRVLSRQVWALTPAAPADAGDPESLRGCCTVDNQAFWSEEFDLRNPVVGAVRMRPVPPGSFDPLHALLVSLLRRSGVDYAEGPEGRPGD